MRNIPIGNQTCVWCDDSLEPFTFAVENGFGAFEWFADKKANPDGTFNGWDETDMDAAMRAWIRKAGRKYGMVFTVHAPWQANPLYAEGIDHLLRSIEFARDIDAGLVNLHLYMDDGAEGYVQSLLPVIAAAGEARLRLSIENTPHTRPEDFNDTFAELERENVAAGSVGMCLDIGHANLCATTRNNYLKYLNGLEPSVPVIHLHVHENYGDADSHLTLFTGPAGESDAGVRGFLQWLDQRDYQGVMILEQWPQPPELLASAATRLSELLGQTPPTGALARLVGPLVSAWGEAAFRVPATQVETQEAM
jgi:sugar phosphate isomerase/epimerase